ncbi:MAG TPA: hypothetical protein VF640_01980 [Acidimicrobiales bacterium]
MTGVDLDPDVLDAVAARLPGLASGLAAVLAPVAAVSGPDVWRGEAASAFEDGLDRSVRVLGTIEADLQNLGCELTMAAARLRAEG